MAWNVSINFSSNGPFPIRSCLPSSCCKRYNFPLIKLPVIFNPTFVHHFIFITFIFVSYEYFFPSKNTSKDLIPLKVSFSFYVVSDFRSVPDFNIMTTLSIWLGFYPVYHLYICLQIYLFICNHFFIVAYRHPSECSV